MRRWAAGLLLAGLLAGCSGGAPGTDASPADDPFAECAGTVSAQSASGLPDLTLPCFHGGMSVRLSQLKGPAVVNLWASWCEPCRKELPAFGDLAAKSAGRLTVLGVVTRDERDSAAALAEELGISFPAVFDERARLATALVERRLATSALPVTLFMKDGQIAFAYQGPALDAAGLDRLVDEHLGVTL